MPISENRNQHYGEIGLELCDNWNGKVVLNICKFVENYPYFGRVVKRELRVKIHFVKWIAI